MDTFRKFIAGVCAVLFIISGIATLFAFNIEWKAFDSATYKRAFEKQNLYERIPALLANALFTFINQNVNTDPYLKAITVDDWQVTIATLLPPLELKATTDLALDSVFDYVNNRSDTAVISLLPLKSTLLGPAGITVAKQILQAQPDCTTEQLLQIGLGLLNGDIALCNPPEEMLGLVTPMIESQFQAMTLTIPDEIILIGDTPIDPQADPRVRLTQARTLLKITPVFPLLFLFGVTIFGVRSLVDWLKWWGWPFLLTGAASSVLALIGSPVLGWIIQRVMQIEGSVFIPPILLSALGETVSVVSAEILSPVAIEGSILAFFGLLMVLVGIFVTKQRARLI